MIQSGARSLLALLRLNDRILTKKLIAAGKLLDIRIADHIIIGKECYYSFRERGEMDF